MKSGVNMDIKEEIKEFYNDFIQDIEISAESDKDFSESMFIEKSMSYLIEEGIIEDFTHCAYIKSETNIKIDAYNFDFERGILYLFISDFKKNTDLRILNKKDIETILKKIKKFFVKSIEDKLYSYLEETSEGYLIANFLYENQKLFRVINFITHLHHPPIKKW